MIFRITLLWLAGMVTIVPYAVYQLLFVAEKDQYAFLIVIPLFWIFGFWGVVGPAIAAYRIHRLMRAFDMAHSNEQLRRAFEENEGEEVIIDIIATENHLPRFIARRLYKWFVQRLLEKEAAKAE